VFYPESLSAYGDAAMCPANGDVLVRVNNSSMFPVVVGDSTVPCLANSRKAYMLTVLDVESSPCLYYVARKLPGGVGRSLDSRLTAGVPSALFGAWSAWLVWRIALSLGLSRRVGALAGFLVAVLAGAVYYGQEARMYAALAAFVWSSTKA
jgi:hypothetical protein